MIQHINRHILTMDHYTDPHQFEPLLPQRRLEEFRARTRGVIEQAVGLSGSAHPVTIATLRELVREMNSYYSNRIEGQSTHPLNIERALHQDFSDKPDVAKLQRLALAHIDAERELEARVAELEAVTKSQSVSPTTEETSQQPLLTAEEKKAADFHDLAHEVYPIGDIGSRPASGSAVFDAMVIAPCSIHSMSAIATGITDNLLTRAADVMLKERRRLILMVRETPLHLGHLRALTALAEMGAIIAPPVPAFYHKPQTAMDIVEHSVDRVMDLLGLPADDAQRWDGGRSTR